MVPTLPVTYVESTRAHQSEEAPRVDHVLNTLS